MTAVAMETRSPLRTLTATYVVLDASDVDTDQIIPARFLTTTEREGLGRWAFADRRQESPERFPLDAPEAEGAQVLVAGRNFGCGSSREHAVWALADRGFRAVIAPSFADIFRANAHANGLLPVEVPDPIIRALGTARASRADARVTIDLEACRLTTPEGAEVSFVVPPFARHCILEGLDELAFLLEAEAERADYERTRRSGLDTRAAVRASEVTT
ncbi:MAG TPA: 3-isopropylmalate dehydratase small subunit [Gemmatimonadaceae bacterium]|nr:3-isopropylmalate dehydratase small subunit [Gemmatimonadaceae bacterium]